MTSYLVLVTVLVLHPCMSQTTTASSATLLMHVFTVRLLCEFFYPRTFDGLCLIEPVIGDNIDDVVVREQYPTMASAKRRDTWDSL